MFDFTVCSLGKGLLLAIEFPPPKISFGTWAGFVIFPIQNLQFHLDQWFSGPLEVPETMRELVKSKPLSYK